MDLCNIGLEVVSSIKEVQIRSCGSKGNSLEVQKHYVSKITATRPEEWGSGVRSQNLALFMTKTAKINASSKTKMA